MKKRVFVNPVIGEKATLIRSAEETNGEYILFEIEVVPGGGNTLHVHETYSEKFDVLEGELSIQLGKKNHIIKQGESVIVPKNTLHWFTNRSNNPVKFNVEFRPAQPGFEKTIAMAYGLASDGLMSKKNIPNKFSCLAILVTMSGSIPVGLSKFFLPVIRWVASHSRKAEASLISKYC